MTQTERELITVIVALETARPALIKLGRVHSANDLFALQANVELEFDRLRTQAAAEDNVITQEAINAPPGGWW